MTSTSRATLTPGLITRTLFSLANRRWTSTLVVPGVVRTRVRVLPGDTEESVERLTRDAANRLLQNGYDVARTGALITVTEQPVDDPAPARFVTVVVTVAVPEGTDLNALGTGVLSALTDQGATLVGCDWEPDRDTVADGVGCAYDDLRILDLNPMRGDIDNVPEESPAPVRVRRLSNGDFRVEYPGGFRNFGKRRAQAEKFAESINKEA